MILCACVAFLLFLTCVYMPSLTGSETCLNLQSKHLSLGSVASLSPFIHYLTLSRTHSMYTCVCAAQHSVTCAGDLKSCNKHAASEEKPPRSCLINASAARGGERISTSLSKVHKVTAAWEQGPVNVVTRCPPKAAEEKHEAQVESPMLG